MSKVSAQHKMWRRDPKYQAAYDELAREFKLARSVIEARTRAGLTQDELARRMETTQSVIARLESGRAPVHKDTREVSPRDRHPSEEKLRGERRRRLIRDHAHVYA